MLFKGKWFFSTDGKEMCCCPHYIEYEMLVLGRVRVLIWQTLCFYEGLRVDTGGSIGKLVLSTLIFIATDYYLSSLLLHEFSLSSGASLLLPCVFVLHDSFQLTPFISVISQIEGVKSLGVLFLILSGQQVYFQR